MKGYFVVLIVMLYNPKINGEQFTCTSSGRFPNPYDPICKTYVRCVDLGTGSYLQTIYQCPSSLFDPNIKECSTTYACDKKTFECTSSGRFADPNDATCRKYYYCVNLFFTFFKFSYNCLNSNFDPQIGKCSTNYACPANIVDLQPIETTSNTLSTTTTPHPTTLNTIYTNTNTLQSSATRPPFIIQSTNGISTRFQQISTNGVTIEGKTYQNSLQSTPVFKCPGSGKYPDPRDGNCIKYIFCVPTVGGGYYKRTYKCANGYFDPNLQKCSQDFACGSSAIVESTTQNLKSTTNFPGPLYTTTNAQISNEATGTYSPEITSFFQTTASQEFRCVTSGRFANPFDEICETYFLCSKLNNGTFLKTPYKCSNSKFDANLKICSKQYICPHLQITSSEESTNPATSTNTSYFVITEVARERTLSTEARSTVKMPISTGSDSTQQLSSEKGTNDASLDQGEGITRTTLLSTINGDVDTSKGSTEYLSSSEKAPIVHVTHSIITTETNPMPEEFICTSKGKFPDATDKSCNRYILCSALRNGSFIQTHYSCPNSYFDPILKVCSIKYICSNLQTSSEGPAPGRLTNYPASITKPPHFITTLDASQRTLFTEAGSAVKMSISTRSDSTQKLSTEKVTNNASQDAGQGTTRTTLQPNGNTEYLPSTEKALEKTTFTAMPSVYVTHSSITTEKNPAPEEFMCTSKGKFPDTTDKSCKLYILCSPLRNGTFIQTYYSCPNSYFDPILKACSRKYVCLTNQITTTITEETTEPTTDWEHRDFHCTKIGRFANLNDPYCKSYYLCNQLRNGSFVQTAYPCPSTSVFDSRISLCSSQIACKSWIPL